jgi:uncharacterized protein YbaP (TraB family)
MVTQRMIRCFLALALALASFAAAAQAYLWEVASLSNRVYLYGTVHAGKKEWFPLHPVVEKALSESQILVVEADILDTAKMSASGKELSYKPPDELRNHVAAADYERFRKIMPRYKLAEHQVAQMNPFMAVSLLVFSEWARLGFSPELSVDAYIIKKARAEFKPVVEIEGIELQTKLIESLTDAENRAIFAGTLTALESGLTGDQINGMVSAWQRGDAARMLEVAQKYNDNVEGAAAFEEKFVWARHEPMLAKIQGYLDSREVHFIAVGALHLAGPRGLVELLRKRGYIVRQR